LASREVFWNISYGYLVYLLAILGLAYWAFRFYQRCRIWRMGRPDEAAQGIARRIPLFIRTVMGDLFTHRRFFRSLLPGTMHFFLFWGFILLLIASAIDATTYYSGLHMTGSIYLWFSLIVDLAGLFCLVGVILAAYRRYILKPKQLVTLPDDGIVMILLAVILVTGFMVEGFRQAATELKAHPDWAVWSPGGYLFALAFSDMSQSGLRFWHRFFWWFHAILSIGTIAYAAAVFSKLQHLVVSPLNIFFRSFGPIGSPAPIDIEKEELLGVGRIKDFTWKQLLDLDACTNCGRCQDVCPAWATSKPLSPRKLIQDLKGHMLRVATAPHEADTNLPALIGENPNEAEIWACTTCGGCQEACPVYVEHIVKILDLRRHLMLVENRIPETAQVMLRNMQQRGHPWAGAQAMRLRGDWIAGQDLKVLAEGDQSSTLLWVGCTGALVERNVLATLSLTHVLKAARIDFAVLGEAETCCGDPARRTGYEFQYQIMAEQNIETFKNHGIQEIITLCPHCYNTLKNEYPRYGGKFKVVHYSELIAELLRQGRLELTQALPLKLTYHDPCYLGRYNRIYREPRQILKAIPRGNFIEMKRSKDRAFCCGGGGGHMWVEEHPGTTKINSKRMEEVLETGVETVVTACPYCLQMFEEVIDQKELKEKLRARDLAEIVESAMKGSP